jgi:trigger factor
MAKEKKENELEITVKIEGKEWEEALEKSFQKNVKNAKIPGFRPGKAPRDLYEKKYGKESLYGDAADLVLQTAYTKALTDNKVVPIIQPKVDLKSLDENGVEFVFKIITKPEVKIKKYKGLGVKKEKVEVTDHEVEHEIEHILERFAELQLKENGTIEEGNTVVIDFEGFKDGVAFEGGKAENYSLEIGSHTFIPGFEEQLIGSKQGEEKEIKVTFPEDYHAEDLKGKEVIFKVKINEVKEKVNRELDKDFFEDLGMEGVDSKESLEKEVREVIKARKETDAENKYVDDLLEAIGKNTEVNIPDELVEEETERLLHSFEEKIKMQGISLELYYQFTKSTEADLKKMLEKEAFDHVLYRLMLEEIMELEKIEVTEEEAEKEAEELAKKYGMEKSEFLKQFGSIDMIKYDLEMRKLLDFLKENNK